MYISQDDCDKTLGKTNMGVMFLAYHVNSISMSEISSNFNQATLYSLWHKPGVRSNLDIDDYNAEKIAIEVWASGNGEVISWVYISNSSAT